MFITHGSLRCLKSRRTHLLQTLIHVHPRILQLRFCSRQTDFAAPNSAAGKGTRTRQCETPGPTRDLRSTSEFLRTPLHRTLRVTRGPPAASSLLESCNPPESAGLRIHKPGQPIIVATDDERRRRNRALALIDSRQEFRRLPTVSNSNTKKRCVFNSWLLLCFQ
jgi:hypothetical protein